MKRHVLVTGGANGIGRALVTEFYQKEQAEVTIVDRDAVAAMALVRQLSEAGNCVRFLPADFSLPHTMEALAEELAQLSPLDVCIFNAGINRASPFFAGGGVMDEAMIDVNFLSPILLTRELLAGGCCAAGGTLVYICSLSVFCGYPGAAVYAGSKDGLHSFANSLRGAVRDRDLHVLSVYPGPTETEQARDNSPLTGKKSRRMAPEVLAAKIADAVKRHRRRLIPGAGNRAAALAGRLFPATMERMMRRLLFEKMKDD